MDLIDITHDMTEQNIFGDNKCRKCGYCSCHDLLMLNLVCTEREKIHQDQRRQKKSAFLAARDRKTRDDG